MTQLRPKSPNLSKKYQVGGLILVILGLTFYASTDLHVKGFWLAKTVVAHAGSPARMAATPVPPKPSISTKLINSWQAVLANHQGSVDIAVYDHATGQIAHYTNSGGAFYTASIVKLSILEALLLEDQTDGQALTSSQLAQATPMIENSNNDAASDLWSLVGGATAMNNFFQQIGATSTTAGPDDEWGLTQTTALDQLKVVNALAYPGKLLTASSAAAADGLLDEVEADQRWGVSGGVPAGVSIELKDGWLQYPTNWIINSIGHIHGDGADYTIAVVTSGNLTEQSGIDIIQSLSSATWSDLAP